MGHVSRRSVMVGAAALAAAPIPWAARAEPLVHEVTIKSFTFEPQLVRARVGDKIRWTNEDLAPHTATADEFGWDTEELATGQSAEIVVTEGMETSYFCIFHHHMKAVIEIIA